MGFNIWIRYYNIWWLKKAFILKPGVDKSFFFSLMPVKLHKFTIINNWLGDGFLSKGNKSVTLPTSFSI